MSTLVVGAAVATGLAIGPHGDGSHSARCYRTVTTDFTGDAFDGVTVDAPPMVFGMTVAPVSACDDAWAAGVLIRRVPWTDPADLRIPPHLVGCVLPDGTAATFPGPEGTCQTVGLRAAATA